MLAEFYSIIIRSLKLDKTIYKEKKYFEHEAGIYFAVSIIILTALISIIPNNAIAGKNFPLLTLDNAKPIDEYVITKNNPAMLAATNSGKVSRTYDQPSPDNTKSPM